MVDGDLAWPLRRAAQQFAHHEAVVDGTRRLTYAELARRVGGLGSGLRMQLGLAPGDVVAMLAGNSLEYVEAWLGIPAAGLVLNPLNFRLAEAELAFILDDSGAVAIAADERWFDPASRLADRCAAIRHLIRIGPVAADPPAAAGSVATGEDLSPGPADLGQLIDLDADPPFGSEPGRGDDVGRYGALDSMTAYGGTRYLRPIVGWDLLCAPEPLVPTAPLAPETLAAISYTGGTTGLPKGVMQSHGNLLANARHVLIGLPLTPADRFFHASPMFHSAGAANVFATTWMGGAHVVLPAFEAGAFLELAARERITSTVIVPTMLNAIVNHPSVGAHDLSAWRLFHIGAAPPPVELLRRAAALLPCDIRQVYGATETSPHVSSTRPGDVRRWLAAGDLDRLRSCGVPDIGVEVSIRSTAGTASSSSPGEMPTAEVGELWARGPNVMLGYWNRPLETDAALVDGWYRTGDLGYTDADGYLYLVDRAKDMIISGGENVYTAEVENALYLHPAVLEAAVFGIPDAHWGEAVHAEVVLKPGADATVDELVAHCRERIAGYKVPRSLGLRTEPLPKSGANKILKRQLRARVDPVPPSSPPAATS